MIGRLQPAVYAINAFGRSPDQIQQGVIVMRQLFAFVQTLIKK